MMSNEDIIYDKCIKFIDTNIDYDKMLSIPITINSAIEIVTLASKIDVNKFLLKERLVRRLDFTMYDIDKTITRKIFDKSKRKYERQW